MLKRIASALIFGLAGACMLNFLAIVVAGAGHGWTSPFRFSFLAFGIFPLAVFQLQKWENKYLWIDVVLLALGLLLNVKIYIQTMREGGLQLYGPHIISLVWILPWLSWQIALVWKLVFVLGRAKSDRI
jgi:hypothetical protein